MIAVVVPTIRNTEEFEKAWEPLLEFHDATLIVVKDGEEPVVLHEDRKYTINEIMGPDKDLIGNRSAAVRTLGFIYAVKIGADTIITLDDDCRPEGDTIQDHLNVLERQVPISWFPTTVIESQTDYMRGFPYQVRREAQVMLSHGVWSKVPDRDAPTQLIAGSEAPVKFFRGVIPRGAFFPFCGMNVAFKKEALPYLYYAPVGDFRGAERFDDIWGGLLMKKDFDKQGWAVVSGYSSVVHSRASNVFASLEKEATGIRLNEEYWQWLEDRSTELPHVWFKEFHAKRERWQKLVSSLIHPKK